MSTCICAAVQNEGNQIMIYDNYKTSPFSSFKRYYGKITKDLHYYGYIIVASYRSGFKS